jgi:hypothetical protein
MAFLNDWQFMLTLMMISVLVIAFKVTAIILIVRYLNKSDAERKSRSDR